MGQTPGLKGDELTCHTLSMTNPDFVVIGGGIAGMSAAAELALDANVLVLEMESALGFHSTGRSAAYFSPAYGNAVVRTITAASEPFFFHPPVSFTDVPLIRARDRLFIARADQLASADKIRAELTELEVLDPAAVSGKVEILNNTAIGLFSSEGGDIDVNALLQGYIRLFSQRGGQLEVNAEVRSIEKVDSGWRVGTKSSSYTSATLVNAAGAWADHIADLAGLGALGIQAKRRTAILVDAPADIDVGDWPMVVDVDEQFYFKPDAGQLLVSPADETPMMACDVQPEEIDVAVAVDRFMNATSLNVTRVNHKWAGLRSFAPDNTFVLGYDPRVSGFFWLAGQGGYGIQSSPGMSQLVAHALLDRSIESNLGAQLDRIAPDRLID